MRKKGYQKDREENKSITIKMLSNSRKQWTWLIMISSMPEVQENYKKLAAVDIVARKDRILMIRKHILEISWTECNYEDSHILWNGPLKSSDSAPFSEMGKLQSWELISRLDQFAQEIVQSSVKYPQSWRIHCLLPIFSSAWLPSPWLSPLISNHNFPCFSLYLSPASLYCTYLRRGSSQHWMK